MKKISAAFDGLKFSKATMDYAMKIAAESNALLSGVFLEDFMYHSYNYFDMVGSQGLPPGKLKHLLDTDKQTRLQAAATFTDNCKKNNINYVIHYDGSFALEDLLKESIYSDLLVIGADETLSHIHEERPTPFIRSLLADVQSPVMIVPAEYHDITRVILLYDGQPSSVFAIKMFNYMMPWLSKLKTEIVYVSMDSKHRELPDNKLIREFIQCHYPSAKYTILTGEPHAKISEYMKKVSKNSMVVLGAYHRGSVSRLFKASMADILMEEMPAPLFIAHNK